MSAVPLEQRLLQLHVWPALLVFLAVVPAAEQLPAAVPAELRTLAGKLLLCGIYAVLWQRAFPRPLRALQQIVGQPMSRSAWRLVLLVSLALFGLTILNGVFGWKLSLMAIANPAPGRRGVAWPLLAAKAASMTVLAPALEELLFRGVWFRRWRAKSSGIRAALGTSLIFGLLHDDVIVATVFGLAMVALYTNTRSLWPCLVAHAINNGRVLVTQHFLAERDLGAMLVELIEDASQPMLAVMAVVFLVVLVVLPLWLGFFFWRSWRILAPSRVRSAPSPNSSLSEPSSPSPP